MTTSDKMEIKRLNKKLAEAEAYIADLKGQRDTFRTMAERLNKKLAEADTFRLMAERIEELSLRGTG